jgi:RND superfamily putative drug exporter
MSRLTAFAAHPRRRVAVLVAWVVLVVLAAGPLDLMTKFSDAEDNESASFLPGDAESTKALSATERLQGGELAPAVVVYHRDGRLTAEDRRTIAADRAELNGLREGRGLTAKERRRDGDVPSTGEILRTQTGPFSRPLVSPNGTTAILTAPIRGNGETETLLNPVDAWRDRVSTPQDRTDGLRVQIGGPAGSSADAVKVFGGINGTLLGAALALVVTLLILIYRSPIFWLVPIAAVIGAEVASRSAGYGLSELGATVNGQSSSILSVLVIGAGTDYALLLVSRYREELHAFDDRLQALRHALTSSGPAIVASGATVVAALLTLTLAKVNATSGLGPIGAMGVFVAVVAMLTLLPALLAVCGRRIFWPFVPRTAAHPVSELRLSARGRRLATGSRGRVAATAIGLGILVPLLAMAVVGGAVGAGLGALGLGALAGLLGLVAAVVTVVLVVRALAPHVHNPVEVRLADRAAKTTETGAWNGLGERISRGPRRVWIGATVVLLICCLGLTQLHTNLTQNDAYRSEVESQTAAKLLAEGFPAGGDAPTDVVVPDASQVRAVMTAARRVPGVADVRPAVGNDGRPVTGRDGTLLSLQLQENPYSLAAQRRIPAVRRAVQEAGGPGVLVGGQTAISYDQKDAASRDTLVIVPVALVVVLLILMLLLRALVAPLLLILTVVLSFAAALGVSVLVWEHVFGFSGTDPSIPLYAFVFLVALGIDYNIFLMARVREESATRGTRAGMIRGLGATGGVITSAGIVLAGTFAVLGVLPLVFLTEIGFAVAFGVLLDTFVVRSVLVPALTLDVGRRVWWPSALGRRQDPS